MSNPIPPPPPPASNSSYSSNYDQYQSGAPPLPPLPPDFRVADRLYNYESPPHFQDPLVAPRPQRVDPSIPGNMARTLDDQLVPSYLDSRLTTPVPPPPPTGGINYNPGFSSYSSPPPQPVTGQSMPQWSPWVPSMANASYGQPSPRPQGALTPAQVYQSQVASNYGAPQRTSPQQSPTNLPQSGSLSPAMAALSFGSPTHSQRNSSYSSSNPSSSKAPSPPRSNTSGSGALTAPLPTISVLTSAISAIQNPSHDPNLKIAWCRDVIFLVNRAQQTNSSTDPAIGPVRIFDPQLLKLSQIAVPLILQLASPSPMPSPMPAYVSEAIYLRATFAASGGFPDQVQHSPRTAFRDFEMAARGGYSAAWFRLGRDYEGFNDYMHAKDCFERGVKLGVESCTYRMGMAHLMGQLGLQPNPDYAVPLLHRAAVLASVDVPQPAYVFALLLLNEFAQVTVSTTTFMPYIPSGSTIQNEARRHLERAAYLNFAPAQYKLGHAYEFAQSPFLFDPLLSVQYYSLASQQGETEADMALSKWFLCGAEGAFDKDEALAYTFAEKAARKGLPSAEFALGYYAEVGVGGPKDIDAARKYYQQAADHGNEDAVERLRALSQPSPHSLTRLEHDTITENKLVRKRTQAKQQSDSLAKSGNATASSPRMPDRPDGRQLINSIRKNSMLMPASGEAVTPWEQGGGASQQRQPRPPHHEQTMPLQPRPRPGIQDPHRSGTSPGGPATSPSPNVSPNMRPQHQKTGGRPQTFTLTDPGSGPGTSVSGRPGSSAGRAQQQQNLGAGRSSAAGRVLSGAAPAPSSTQSVGITPAGREDTLPRPAPGPAEPSKKGPATFAEMGIATSKVSNDKDCIIM